jgi:hypothetical protein
MFGFRPLSSLAYYIHSYEIGRPTITIQKLVYSENPIGRFLYFCMCAKIVVTVGMYRRAAVLRCWISSSRVLVLLVTADCCSRPEGAYYALHAEQLFKP